MQVCQSFLRGWKGDYTTGRHQEREGIGNANLKGPVDTASILIRQ